MGTYNPLDRQPFEFDILVDTGDPSSPSGYAGQVPSSPSGYAGQVPSSPSGYAGRGK